MDSTTIKCSVNGEARTTTCDPQRPLLYVLREDFGLTGTKYGCGEGQCGACTVLVDGKRTFSCLTGCGEVEGKKITTIEGMARGEALHPVQQAFLDEGAFQCGYCTPGMIMATAALLAEKPNPSEQDVRGWMNTNMCRCCGYVKVLSAVRRAATAVAGTGAAAGKGVQP
jgi:aerobic-type carbon monoxide dehydrogenase small subunit (CoxS/CutS family)